MFWPIVKAIAKPPTDPTDEAQPATGKAGDGTLALRALCEHLDGIVYRTRRAIGWSHTYLSPGCLGLVGYTAQQLLHGRRLCFDDLIHLDDRASVWKQRAAVLNSRGRYQIEYRLYGADGLLRWVSDRGGASPAEQGEVEGVVVDITGRKLADLAADESDRHYRGLFDHAIEGIFRTTADGRYLTANPALARIYGFESSHELIHSLRDIRNQLYVDPARREEFMRVVRARGSISGFESQVYRRDGSIIWISENARAVEDADGSLLHYEGTVEDITERKIYEARLQRQATCDALTGLANRMLFNERLEQAIRACELGGDGPAVVFVDLDRFKFINDSLGHQMGDELLCTMAKRLRGCVRECDTVARLGGDEFVVLVAQHGGVEVMREFVERVIQQTAVPWAIEHGTFHITCSVGVALYPQDGDSAAALLTHADSAMYRAKELGRNGYQFYSQDLNRRLTERLVLQRGLAAALELQQLELHYQPLIDFSSGRVVGAEALLRWSLPGQGYLPPDRFIPIAEESGLIVPIGAWVLQRVCQQIVEWQHLGLTPPMVSVNVSVAQLQQQDFGRFIAATLAECGLSARQLQLELTESLVMDGAAELQARLRELKALGLTLAIDDFGTGYSSLSYLKRFDVDRIKIDRSFVTDLREDSDDAAIVRTIIALGHSLGLRIVAEGVETQEQARFLRDNGCDEAQGFLYSRPLDAAQFTALLRPAQHRPDS